MSTPSTQRGISLITITHTGAYSIVEAARAAGMNVCAPQGIAIADKVAQLQDAGRDSDLLWAHWAWIGLLPRWVLRDRHVCVVLRNPIDCALSAWFRGNAGKEPQHARQWLNLFNNMKHVDAFHEFMPASFEWLGEVAMPHRNASHDVMGLREKYRNEGVRALREPLSTYWSCLRVVRPEIARIFRRAKMMPIIAGTMFDPQSTKVPIADGLV